MEQLKNLFTIRHIYKYSIYLFDKLWDKDNYIRGLCVGVSNFSSNHDKQLSLFDLNNINKMVDKKKDESDDKKTNTV